MGGSLTDITSLFPQDEEAELGFRQGRVVSFTLVTGANVIDMGGVILTNVPMLNLSASTVLTTNDIVGLLRYKTRFFILGRIITPPI